jgi:hypothetical protein
MKFIVVLALCIAGASAFCYNAGPMMEAWNHIKYNEVEILYTVFKQYPDIQAKFPKFAGKDLEKLKDTAEFAIHATRIIGLMSEVIALFSNDSNLPAIKTVINQLGTSHKERGVTGKNFDDFHKALHTYLPTNTKWNDKVEESWLCVETEVRKMISAALEGNLV